MAMESVRFFLTEDLPVPEPLGFFVGGVDGTDALELAWARSSFRELAPDFGVDLRRRFKGEDWGVVPTVRLEE